MPEYLSPGVYVEEISTGPVPIEGVSTSTAAMLGATERGPEYPKLITSWLQFQRWYGSYIPDRSYLAYAVQGFFDNGGQRVFIGRVIADDAVATAGAIATLTLTASGRGIWGNNVMVKVSAAGNQRADNFRVSILYYRVQPPNFPNIVDPTSSAPADLTNPNRREPDVLEVYDNLTIEDGASNNAATVINSNSKLVRAAWNGVPAQPGAQPFTQLGNGGADGSPIGVADFQGDLDAIGGLPDDLLGRGRGLAAIATIDEVSILLVPDEVRGGLDQVTTAVLNQCETLKDRFAVVSVIQGQSDPAPVNPPRDSSYGAFYYPWIEIFDPSINDTRLIPPTGHVAGIFARTDIERGVHKAPANEVIRGAVDLEFPVPKGNQDILNPRGVNCVRDFRTDGRGIRLWGARTMSSLGEWKYINVRRLFLFVEESIDEGTQWVVFEPNDEPLWARVRRSITNFLISVWRSGALMGVTQEEAFFVKCDRTTMTQDDIDNGRLICYIGIAPVKPAEFVIFRISQKTIEAQQ